jgi:hypothetical protein
MDIEKQWNGKRMGVIMRVDPEFKEFCRVKAFEMETTQVDVTRDVLKNMKRGIITWI